MRSIIYYRTLQKHTCKWHDLNWLQELIEIAKQRLIELSETHSLVSAAMIRKSQQLDKFLNRYNQLKQARYINKEEPIALTIDSSEE